MPFSAISIVGLILHELAANATKHGAWSTDQGRVNVGWKALQDSALLEISWAETGGPPVDPGQMASGTGTAIVDRLLAAARGTIERSWSDAGLRATISMPARTD
ncbi:hypothetical protein [Erythrobacter sp. JK5]|uniref:hypothetical protein n=1 Tax=Erythrobacter sp. JK5 TaxID=2829500 RepID=UPI002739E64F|nr:hypothetical protein [Erythrobacter sp. JK5]